MDDPFCLVRCWVASTTAEGRGSFPCDVPGVNDLLRGATIHGLRSSFHYWAVGRTQSPQGACPRLRRCWTTVPSCRGCGTPNAHGRPRMGAGWALPQRTAGLVDVLRSTDAL